MLKNQPDGIGYSDGLVSSGRPLPGAHDLYALALAKQEESMLLSADKLLRRLAEEEHIAVHGTIWLVQQLIDGGHITEIAARQAFQQILESGSWLPQADIMELVE